MMRHYTSFFSLIILLTLSNQLFANSDKKAQELKNYFWENSHEDFKVTEVPEKWANKSAVIIARSYEKFYTKRRIGGLMHLDYMHYRIKILSKKALEEFAQFTFPESTKVGVYQFTFYAGFKIIKSDGTEIEVPISDAVVSEMEVNKYQFNTLKLAIPNLEIGDIVDYYIAEEQNIPANKDYYSFEPVIFQLNAAYPVMKQKILFDVERKCYLNAKSLNGAPELVRSNKETNDVYILEDEDRENINDIKWFYPYRELPAVKFKVVYAKASLSYSPLFLGKPGVLKNTVSKREAVKFALAYLNDYQVEGAQFYKRIKKYFKGRTDKSTLAKELYYFLRSRYVSSYTEAFIMAGQEQYQEENDYKMISILTYLYDQYNIKYKLLVGVPRSISAIDDLILEDEMVCSVQVLPSLDENFYIGDFNNYSIVGDYFYLMEGAEVFKFSGESDIEKVDFPSSTKDENKIISKVELSINDFDTGSCTAKIRSKAIGHHKKTFQYNLLDFYDYKNEEISKYKITDYATNLKNKAKANYTQKKITYLEELEQKKLDYLKVTAEEEYDFEIEKVKDFHILTHGRHHETPAFEFVYKIDFKGIVKKTGDNYLINVGKLIERQVTIEKEELNRKYDIHMPYARSFKHTITLNIPKGYEVQGLESLNIQHENETGGFTSNTKIENYKLKINTYKFYESNFVAKENWKDLYEFLKTAEDFTQKSILLKKISK